MLLKINVNDSVCTIEWLIEIAVLETRPTLYVFVKCLVFVLIFSGQRKRRLFQRCIHASIQQAVSFFGEKLFTGKSHC